MINTCKSNENELLWGFSCVHSSYCPPRNAFIITVLWNTIHTERKEEKIRDEINRQRSGDTGTWIKKWEKGSSTRDESESSPRGVIKSKSFTSKSGHMVKRSNCFKKNPTTIFSKKKSISMFVISEIVCIVSMALWKLNLLYINEKHSSEQRFADLKCTWIFSTAKWVHAYYVTV